jgi:hypothetical protein
MSGGVSVLLVLITGCWLFMLRSISLWINSVAVPGRESDKLMRQLNSGLAAAVIWLLLGGLLLLVNVKGVLPEKVGFASWFLLPVSGVLALAALGAMYDPAMRWAVIIPASAPLLIAGYAAYLCWPSASYSTTRAGFLMWGVVIVMGLIPLPRAITRFEAAGDNGSIEAKPGPEMDRWMAKENERRRQAGLDELRKIDEDTTLNDLEHLTRGDSPVKADALEAMRHLPARQAQAEKALMYEYSGILPLLPQIDIQPSPALCSAAKEYLRKQIAFQKKQFPAPTGSMLAVLEEGLPGVAWMATHCDCTAELDQLDELVKGQLDSPTTTKFREALAAMRK